LEGLNERVLYDYDEVLKRRGELDKPVQIDDLKLAPHYESIRPKSLSDAEALKLFQQLEAYDALLDEIGLSQPAISYNDLIDGWMHRIAPIFGIQPNEEQHYRTGWLRLLYRQRDMFLSDKANALYLYEGIWFDESDLSYLVGSTQGINKAQARAHVIRRFDVYQRNEHVDVTPLLTSMSIRFIRLKQFTVYPYPFHLLISLYAESMLQARVESFTSDEEQEE
jgi:hypothetical protein